MITRLLVQAFLDSPSRTCTRVYDCVTHPQNLRVLASTGKFDCECSRARLRVLTSTLASTRVFICEYSLVFSSLALASFDSRVGNASLACARSHSRLALACDIASDTSHSHTCVYTKNFLWRREKSLRSAIQNAVGRVSRNIDFFQWGLSYVPNYALCSLSDMTICAYYTKHKSGRTGCRWGDSWVDQEVGVTMYKSLLFFLLPYAQTCFQTSHFENMWATTSEQPPLIQLANPAIRHFVYISDITENYGWHLPGLCQVSQSGKARK